MVEKMISNLVKNAPRIPEWILTSIKDPSSKLKRKTSSVEVLKRGVRYLRFGGGGDPQEAILKGEGHRECLTLKWVSNQKHMVTHHYKMYQFWKLLFLKS